MSPLAGTPISSLTSQNQLMTFSRVLSTFSAWDSPWQFSVLRLCSPSSSWCWDATPPWAASWAAPNRSRPSLPASLFSSGASTCSFPPWKPTKSSIPVSKPIFIIENRFWQTAHFSNQPTKNQLERPMITKQKLAVPNLPSYTQKNTIKWRCSSSTKPNIISKYWKEFWKNETEVFTSIQGQDKTFNHFLNIDR